MKNTALFLFGLAAGVTLVAADPFQHEKPVPLAGDDSWDYLTADVAARRLYVTHGTKVHVLDLDQRSLVGEIAPTPGVHGVALAPELGLGFTSNGADATVTVFDLKTLATVRTLKVAGAKPDAILYDPFTHRVFTFNGDSDNSSVFDAATGAPVGTIELGGGPEFAVTDGAGNCYVNLEDKAEVVRFNPRTLEVTARWPLVLGDTPTSLALDTVGHRLLSGCRSKNLIVLDSDTGALVANLPIGGGVDAIALDLAHHRAFVGCGQGMVNVIGWTDPNHYAVTATIPTEPGAKTLAFDSQAGRIFLSTAKLGPVKASSARPAILSGSFHLIVLSAQPN